jgi:TIR domain
MSALHLVGIALATTASVVLLLQLWSAARFLPLTPATRGAFRKPSVFISHNHQDARLAEALVAVLRSALALHAAQIRCTSVSRSKVPHGNEIEDTLRAEIAGAPAFIVLVTPNASKSDFVGVEIGARWFTKKHLAPLLAAGGAVASLLDGPLRNYSALNCDERGDIIQMVEDLGQLLEIVPNPVAAYENELMNLLRESKLEDLCRAS